MNNNELYKLIKKSYKSFEDLWNAYVCVENTQQKMGMFFKIKDNEAIFISTCSVGLVGDKIIIEEMYEHEPRWDPIITHECTITNVVIPKSFVNDKDDRRLGWYKCHLLQIEKTHTQYQNIKDEAVLQLLEALKEEPDKTT